MTSIAANGGAPAGPLPPWHDQIIDASCMPAALGKPSSTRDTLSELASLNMNLSDSQMLTGYLHPNDICGTLAHDLGKRFSNALLAVGLRILDFVSKGSYNTSNFIVARVNDPRKLLSLPASARPKAEPAKSTLSTVTYVLMDQGQHAGQWVKIDVVQNDLSTSVMTPIESSAQTALQQAAQPAAAAVPTLPSAASTVANNNSSYSITNTNSQVQSTATSKTAPAIVPQHANISANSSQDHIFNQFIDPSLPAGSMATSPAVQQGFISSADAALSYTALDTHLEPNDMTSGSSNTNRTSSTRSGATEDTRETSLSASDSPTQSQSIAQTRPTVAAVQARKRRRGETADQDGTEADLPKRVKKDSDKVLPGTSEDPGKIDRDGPTVPTPAATPMTGIGNGRPATYPMPSAIAPLHNTTRAAPFVQRRPRRILRTKQTPRNRRGEQAHALTYAVPSTGFQSSQPYFMGVRHYIQAGWESHDTPRM
ncbi:hypothetical protein AC579_2332 [Pseudocercospora musae]|uniref:Uncharacterized protein n=1 Tax=Pseudocercospora musae TaxID=113226 RepID=A0A139H402_9PEZI|nr:hypothetical protein AC579_2332 [Pseudocercospora musae]